MKRVLELIERLALAGQEASSPVALLEQMCAEIASGFGFGRVVVTSYEADTQEVRVFAAHGLDDGALGAPVPIHERGLLADALAQRDLVFVEDVGAAESLPEAMTDKYRLTSVFTLPLFVQGRCLGFLGGDRGGMRFELDPASTAALRTVGVLVATLLQSALVAEERRRLDAAKSQFVALAAHELRTPIAVIYGITSTLVIRENELAQEQLMELRRTLHQQASRLRFLVDHLLDLSRIDAHAIALKPERMRVRNRVEELVLLTAERRAAEILLDIDPRLEAELDPDAIDRIVSNLLANALKYGEQPITISAEQRDSHFRLAVEDRGVGVPDAFIERLFERFTRAEQLDTTAGSGLGLAIARGYAQSHGGDILFSPAEPHGARFELVVPQQRRP